MHFTERNIQVVVGLVYILHLTSAALPVVNSSDPLKFPDDLLFGVSSAAAQVEGAWNIDGKTESIWDHLVHTNRTFVKDGSNADVSADSYHKYKEDVQLLRELGVNFYRFSFSWPRILPTGFSSKVNKAGLDYYNNLINELIKYNITPMATIYHWDLPQSIQKLGGWANPNIIDYYSDFASVLFNNFANRVKFWVTFNEPMQVCEGYGGDYRAPAILAYGIGEYLCSNNLIKAHARVFHLYDIEFRPQFAGKVGIVLDSNWAEPKTNSTQDKKAAELYLHTHVGWFANPIFSKQGNYHPLLIQKVAEASQRQNFRRSRLPTFSPVEVEYIKGTADFFGLNHYTTYLLTMAGVEGVGPVPSHENDVGVVRVQDPQWPMSPTSNWLKVVPWGFRKLLNWITHNYNGIPIIVGENGYAEAPGLRDERRVTYLGHYMHAMLRARDDGSNVIAYAVWTFLDNFEWEEGFRSRFGIYDVDFKSPNRTRKAKLSAKFYANITRTRRLPSDYDPNDYSAFTKLTSSASNISKTTLTFIISLSLAILNLNY